eukprot:6172232-Pleurochrysis_carterae.AAC.2
MARIPGQVKISRIGLSTTSTRRHAEGLGPETSFQCNLTPVSGAIDFRLAGHLRIATSSSVFERQRGMNTTGDKM